MSTNRIIRPAAWKIAAAFLLDLLSAPFALVQLFLRITKPLAGSIRQKRNALMFEFRSSDIFIVTYPKSGTTWMQMILYQLTTDGDMDFDHIDEVSPWYELLLHAPNPKYGKAPQPRLIKSHLPYRQIPKTPGKYIYVSRDGRDAMVSVYHQIRDTLSLDLSFDNFFDRFMKGKFQYGSWFKHVHDWRRNAKNLEVLYVVYEDLKQDPEKEIRRIAEFHGIELDEKRLSRVLERTSFSFMRDHEDRFGPRRRDGDGRITLKKKGSFIRKGKTGGWRDFFNEDMRKRYEIEHQRWFGKTELDS